MTTCCRVTCLRVTAAAGRRVTGLCVATGRRVAAAAGWSVTGLRVAATRGRVTAAAGRRVGRRTCRWRRMRTPTTLIFLTPRHRWNRQQYQKHYPFLHHLFIP
jgi:hypothetical protein